MSNYLAVATLTATLGRLVGAALSQVVNPSTTPRVRFDAAQPDPQFVGSTIALVRIGFVDRPRAALEADYLLTFAGDEATLEPQRFLGAAIGALHAQPVLTPDAIRQTIAANPHLDGSDLGAQVDLIRITPRHIDQPTIGQLIGGFPHTPHHAWVVYTASPLVIG